MPFYLIASLFICGTIGWFMPLSWVGILAVALVFLFLFTVDEVSKFFIGIIGGVIIIGMFVGSVSNHYFGGPEPKQYITKDGKQYEVQQKTIYVEVNSTNSTSTEKPNVIIPNETNSTESTFWHDFKTYRPFKD